MIVGALRQAGRVQGRAAQILITIMILRINQDDCPNNNIWIVGYAAYQIKHFLNQ